MANKMGRPLKYGHIIKILDPETVYSSSMIASLAEEKQLEPFDEELTTAEQRVKRIRIRAVMKRRTKRYDFPKTGDAFVFLKGQAPVPGWYGKRWLATLEGTCNDHS